MDTHQRRYIEALIHRDTAARGGPPEALVEARGMGFIGSTAAPLGPIAGDPLHDVGDEALEAINNTEHRPTCLISGDVPALSSLPRRWWNLHVHVDPLTVVARAVGRLGPADDPDTFHGTAFLAAPGIVLTSRKVAAAFVVAADHGPAGLQLRRPTVVDFRRERGAPFRPGLVLRVLRARLMHPKRDLAVLEVEPCDELAPLSLARAPAPAPNAVVALVGHPARSSERAVEDRILHRALGFKHMAPGRLVTGGAAYRPEGQPDVLWHDCSTLADWSGAPLVDVATGTVLGIHTDARYLRGGWAVPAWGLNRDRRLGGLGLFRRRVRLRRGG